MQWITWHGHNGKVCPVGHWTEKLASKQAGVKGPGCTDGWGLKTDIIRSTVKGWLQTGDQYENWWVHDSRTMGEEMGGKGDTLHRQQSPPPNGAQQSGCHHHSSCSTNVTCYTMSILVTKTPLYMTQMRWEIRTMGFSGWHYKMPTRGMGLGQSSITPSQLPSSWASQC